MYNVYDAYVPQVNVSVARQNFSPLVDRAQAGEVIPLTRNGKAVAALVPIDLVPDELLARAVLDTPGASLDDIRQHWDEILARLKVRSIVIWVNVVSHAEVVGVDGNCVTLEFDTPSSLRNSTDSGKSVVVARSISDVVGGKWFVEGRLRED